MNRIIAGIIALCFSANNKQDSHLKSHLKKSTFGTINQ